MFDEPLYDWHKIANQVADLAMSNSQVKEVAVGNRTVCVAMHNGVLYGCSNVCPHAGAAMQNGYVDALGNVVCPLHRYKFSLQTGRNVSGEGYYLKRFKVAVREDGVYVGLEKK